MIFPPVSLTHAVLNLFEPVISGQLLLFPHSTNMNYNIVVQQVIDWPSPNTPGRLHSIDWSSLTYLRLSAEFERKIF